VSECSKSIFYREHVLYQVSVRVLQVSKSIFYREHVLYQEVSKSIFSVCVRVHSR
jgi:hypothetical protein